ncbi:MAG: 16S rRNA (guanine(966)-N(2))-methyltransferase RsmD [Eubacteriaceae bacterium]|jgi:16S rRNA (guanine966-N2)-methyltransferase
MRVIGGEKGGIRLAGFSGDKIRPTSDKVKGAVFSSLASLVPDYSVFIDLFAGTGGMGIEALSRGAEDVRFFDRDRRSIDLVKENLKKTGYDKKARVSTIPAQRALAQLADEQVVSDIIFMDPPYKDVPASLALFETISHLGLLSGEGVIVLEHDKSDIIPSEVSDFVKIREKTYGKTVISIFRGRE